MSIAELVKGTFDELSSDSQNQLRVNFVVGPGEDRFFARCQFIPSSSRDAFLGIQASLEARAGADYKVTGDEYLVFYIQLSDPSPDVIMREKAAICEVFGNKISPTYEISSDDYRNQSDD